MMICKEYSKSFCIVFDYFHKINNYLLDKTFFDKNSVIFIMPSWNNSFKTTSIANLNSEYNIVILANSLEEKLFFEKKTNRDVVLCNQNTFVNENMFTIDKTATKKYDLVIDSAFHKYKNTNIAKKIKNTLHIGYFKKDKLQDDDIVIPIFGILANFNVETGEYKKFNREQINSFYNESMVGGIFSDCEGACCASSQYLLSGIPVISIKSKGGRDLWYNKDNSIICENDENSVYNAHILAINKLKSGEFNREKIRELHLQQMDYNRNVLIEYIKNKVLPEGEKIDIDSIKKMLAFI